MQKVLEFIKQNLLVSTSLKEDGDKIKISRNLQHFISMRPFSDIEQTIYEKILSFAVSAEKTSPGAGVLFLQKIVDKSSNDVNNKLDIHNRIELMKRLEILKHDKIISDMLLESLNIASLNTVFMIKKSSNSFISLEYTEGFKFKILQLINVKGIRKLKNPKVICVDGYVESVSEIHHILQKLSETQEECVFLCRGMSEDVRHTIKVNFERQTLNMIPYIVPFDLEFCNTLVDVAVVTGGDVISTTKGQLISSIEWEKIPTIEFCECAKDSLVLFNKKTKSIIKKHVENIKTKIKENPDVETFNLTRIKSLTASCLEFKLPDDLNYNNRCQQLDEGIRLISSEINKISKIEIIVTKLIESYHSLCTDVVFTN